MVRVAGGAAGFKENGIRGSEGIVKFAPCADGRFGNRSEGDCIVGAKLIATGGGTIFCKNRRLGDKALGCFGGSDQSSAIRCGSNLTEPACQSPGGAALRRSDRLASLGKQANDDMLQLVITLAKNEVTETFVNGLDCRLHPFGTLLSRISCCRYA